MLSVGVAVFLRQAGFGKINLTGLQSSYEVLDDVSLRTLHDQTPDISVTLQDEKV